MAMEFGMTRDALHRKSDRVFLIGQTERLGGRKPRIELFSKRSALAGRGTLPRQRHVDPAYALQLLPLIVA
ncbi:hypothetical protein BGV51_12935 [Burkholderia ubonensis]|nr:hypothetical protein BGV51_12935 [Burkholderia ubonensis]